MMKIGILVCGNFPSRNTSPPITYSTLYSKMLDGRGFMFKSYSVVDMEFPTSIYDADGWLISGSRYGAYDQVPFIPLLEEFIRLAYASQVPLVAICFGHQILAQALGGAVEKFSGGWNCGPTTYEFMRGSATLHAWHQDQVMRVPDEGQVIASGSRCRNAAISYRGRAFSVQPHPEFGDEEVRMIAEGRARRVVPGSVLLAVENALGTPLNNEWMADRIAEFFKDDKRP